MLGALVSMPAARGKITESDNVLTVPPYSSSLYNISFYAELPDMPARCPGTRR